MKSLKFVYFILLSLLLTVSQAELTYEINRQVGNEAEGVGTITGTVTVDQIGKVGGESEFTDGSQVEIVDIDLVIRIGQSESGLRFDDFDLFFFDSFGQWILASFEDSLLVDYPELNTIEESDNAGVFFFLDPDTKSQWLFIEDIFSVRETEVVGVDNADNLDKSSLEEVDKKVEDGTLPEQALDVGPLVIPAPAVPEPSSFLLLCSVCIAFLVSFGIRSGRQRSQNA